MSQMNPMPHTGLLLTIMLGFMLKGCTVIRLGVGAAVDLQTHDRMRTLSLQKLHQLTPGRPMKVTLMDGTFLRGKFQGFTHQIDPVYVNRYTTATTADTYDLHLPEWQQEIAVTSSWFHSTRRGKFTGFDHGNLLITANLRRELFPLDKITRIQSASGTTDGATLAKLLATQQLPISTALEIQTDENLNTVPFYTIETVREKVPKRDGDWAADRSGSG